VAAADVVDEIAGRVVVGAVDDDVAAGDDAVGVGRGEVLGYDVEACRRRLRGEASGRGHGFGNADRVFCVQHLTLQVAERDGVAVDKNKTSDAGAGEICRRGRAQTAEPDDGDGGRGETALPFDADFGQHRLA
jgi:hypothetical protein